MDQIRTRLKSIQGLRVARPGERVIPPAAVVLFPDRITFDETYQRGQDSMTLPVAVLVGKVVDRAAEKTLAAYCDGNGPRSIKAVLESGAYTAMESVAVTSAEPDTVTLTGVDYLAASFDLTIIGKGAE